jgi:hypothetical protein
MWMQHCPYLLLRVLPECLCTAQGLSCLNLWVLKNADYGLHILCILWHKDPLLGKDLEINNETTAIAMQRHDNHTSTTRELLLETVFSAWSVPSSYLENNWGFIQRQPGRLTVGRNIRLRLNPGMEYRIGLTVTFLIPWGALSDERMGLSFVCAAGPCQRSFFLVLVPWEGLATVFYCLRFETSLFVASYDSQGHGEGIRPRLHTGP